jgi:shikimate kinase
MTPDSLPDSPDPEPSSPLKDAKPALLTRPIALVGLMGVGKSSIGRRLADHFGVAFVDADDEIEKAAGQSISDIFASLGEQAFREGEQRVIARLLSEIPLVLATGGGAITNARTRQLLKEKAITIWLRGDIKVLARRVANKNHRPLLKDKDPAVVLKDLARQRYPYYAEADLTVDTGDHSHGRTLQNVLEALHPLLTRPA